MATTGVDLLKGFNAYLDSMEKREERAEDFASDIFKLQVARTNKQHDLLIEMNWNKVQDLNSQLRSKEAEIQSFAARDEYTNLALENLSGQGQYQSTEISDVVYDMSTP